MLRFFILLGLLMLCTQTAKAALIQHLDATVAGSIATSAGAVTQWTDQSGKSHHAVPAVGRVTYPGISSQSATGKLGLDFGTTRNSLKLFNAAASDSWLNFDPVTRTNTNGFCVVVAFKCDGLISDFNDLIGNSSNLATGFGMRYTSSGSYVIYLQGSLAVTGTVAAGDTIVMMLNYNAKTGNWTFWDSKSGNSRTGTKEAADFSTTADVTLGSMNNSSRFINGMVGEVKVYDTALNPFEFQNERQTMTQKWVGNNAISRWRVIPEDPNYPTEDAVVAAISVADAGFSHPLPADPAGTDCTATFQEAIDSVYAAGGGTVFVPAGEYMFTGNLIMKDGVELRGRLGAVTDTDKSVRGTILKPTKTTGNFIQLDKRTIVRDLAIWYPNQNLTSPIAYGPTISGNEVNGVPSRTDNMGLENVYLVNSYVGFQSAAQTPFANVRRVYGTPLSIGLYQFDSPGVPRYSEIYFSPDYWAQSGLPGAPTSSSTIRTYLQSTGAIGIKIGSSDNIFAAEWYISGYHTGIACVNEGVGTLNGKVYGAHATDCVIGMRIDDIGDTNFINCEFQGSQQAVLLKDWHLHLYFNGCSFTGGTSSYCIEDAHENGLRTLVYQNCTFVGAINANQTKLIVINSDFSPNTPSIVCANNISSAQIIGNRFASATPVRFSPGSASVVQIDNRPTYSDRYTPFDVKGYNRVRKPGGTHLIVIGDTLYPAAGDGTTDDSGVIQSALNAVAAAGGGVVMLPWTGNGYAIRNPITVPADVELRSCGEGMHKMDDSTDYRGEVLHIYYGAGGSTPAIVLNRGSGLKGIYLHYPQNLASAIQPYSFAVSVRGDDAYIQNCQFINAYDCVEFVNVQRGLVDRTFVTPLHRVFKMTGCKDMRLQNVHSRGDWDAVSYASWDLGTSKTVDDVEQYELKNSVICEAVNSTNIECYSMFSRLSNWMAQLTNSTAHMLMFSAEACIQNISVNGIPAGGTVELLGTSMRANRDTGLGSTANSIVAHGNPGDGKLKMFSCLIDGVCDAIIKADDIDIVVQNSQLSADITVPTDGITVTGTVASKVRFEGCTMDSDNAFIPMEVANVSNKRVELVGCDFSAGLEADPYFGAMQSVLAPSSILSTTRLAQVGNQVLPACAISMNLPTPGQHGINLLTAADSYMLVNKIHEFKETRDTITGYQPTPLSGAKTLEFEVRGGLFTGSGPSEVVIKTHYYDSTAGAYTISYRLPGQINYELLNTITLRGDDNWTPKTAIDTGIAANPAWREYTSPKIPSAMFQAGARIKIEVTSGTALFAWLAIASADSKLPLPYSPVSQGANTAPFFLSNPVVKTAATIGQAYSDSIYQDVGDNDAGDSLTYAKVSGPAWLSLSANGALSGTPGAGSGGVNTFVAKVQDAAGLSSTASIQITVNAPSVIPWITSGTSATAATGTPFSYQITANNSPASFGASGLPAGLSVSPATGLISGTPVTTGTSNVTITATNAAGTGSGALTIIVNQAAPSGLTYSSNPATYTRGKAITRNTPTHMGSAIASYAVLPPLPAGLSLNTSTGVISGTPTAETPTANYIVTATNSLGSTTAALSITVVSAYVAWASQYNLVNGPNGDDDGDGNSNYFEFVAGLVPTDTGSVFKTTVYPVSGQANSMAIEFGPIIGGRTYTVKSSTSLDAGTWVPLSNFTSSDAGNVRTLIDTAATGTKQFYVIEISHP